MLDQFPMRQGFYRNFALKKKIVAPTFVKSALNRPNKSVLEKFNTKILGYQCWA